MIGVLEVFRYNVETGELEAYAEVDAQELSTLVSGTCFLGMEFPDSVEAFSCAWRGGRRRPFPKSWEVESEDV